jgi:hypothetical protein
MSSSRNSTEPARTERHPRHTSPTRPSSTAHSDRRAHSHLTHLPDERLLSRLDTLAARERCVTLCILDHLNEVKRRELFLKLGYGSMFSYCTERLGYSESAANRRIRTARSIRRFPRVRELLEDERVSLSTVSKVAGILTEANHADVLARINGKSQREVEAIVAAFRPRSAVRDRITPVGIAPGGQAASASSSHPTLACDHRRCGGKNSSTAAADPAANGDSAAAPLVPGSSLPASPVSKNDGAGDLSAVASSTDGPGPSTAAPAAALEGSATDNVSHSEPETQVLIRFAAGETLVRQIEAARALLSFRLPANASLAQVLGEVLAEFIERNDPSHRATRRTARQAARTRSEQNGEKKPASRCAKTDTEDSKRVERHRNDTSPGDAAPDNATKNARAIPAAIRDDVLAAARGRCQYVSPDGRRCDATRYLQVDHIVPVAQGGTADRANLRVLCAPHNRLEAERLLGEVARSNTAHPMSARMRRTRCGPKFTPLPVQTLDRSPRRRLRRDRLAKIDRILRRPVQDRIVTAESTVGVSVDEETPPSEVPRPPRTIHHLDRIRPRVGHNRHPAALRGSPMLQEPDLRHRRGPHLLTRISAKRDPGTEVARHHRHIVLL